MKKYIAAMLLAVCLTLGMAFTPAGDTPCDYYPPHGCEENFIGIAPLIDLDYPDVPPPPRP